MKGVSLTSVEYPPPPPPRGLPACLQAYFIIAPDCPRIFPSGVTRNGIWPSGGLPAEIMKQTKVSYFLNILCCILENCWEWWKTYLGTEDKVKNSELYDSLEKVTSTIKNRRVALSGHVFPRLELSRAQQLITRVPAHGMEKRGCMSVSYINW